MSHPFAVNTICSSPKEMSINYKINFMISSSLFKRKKKKPGHYHVSQHKKLTLYDQDWFGLFFIAIYLEQYKIYCRMCSSCVLGLQDGA